MKEFWGTSLPSLATYIFLIKYAQSTTAEIYFDNPQTTNLGWCNRTSSPRHTLPNGNCKRGCGDRKGWPVHSHWNEYGDEVYFALFFLDGDKDIGPGRCIVIYSGIHYDAVTLAPMKDAPAEWHQTVFPIVCTYPPLVLPYIDQVNQGLWWSWFYLRSGQEIG